MKNKTKTNKTPMISYVLAYVIIMGAVFLKLRKIMKAGGALQYAKLHNIDLNKSFIGLV